MNFEINQKILLKHLNYVIRGISSKNLIPILNCIKMELTNEGLYLLSTNNDIAIKTFIPNKQITKVINTGVIVVYGRYIYEIIRKLPNETITIEEVLEDKINIYTSKSSFYLNCNKTEDFPTLNLEEQANPIKLNKKVLKNLINQTIFATSNDEARPHLTGLNIQVKEDILKCTATDSYRLSSKEIKLDEKLSTEVNIIIPNKNILELSKIINDDDDFIELHIFSNSIIFKFSDITFMSRLINGTYPNTSALIPNEFSLKLKVQRNDFYNSIDRASLLTNEFEKHTIKLELKENEVTISSNIPEIGKVEEKILVEKNNENNIIISFSSKYMLDALKSMEDEFIEILFNGELKPIIIKNINDESLTQLILPIRTY
ncbi:MAG: DNA polymerase III subunit beta [Bacilli bacterium]|nr:DNA polymerase III subunit beta [Bacilli bacterium]MDD4547265.1 DNA polymerase III subunit beta [Bacilli bacterium]